MTDSNAHFPDSSQSLDMKPNVSAELCRICEMAATGNNFGIPTCESCKTFFRRNAKREPKKCLHDGNCKVIKEFRKSCTACRLNKCFGMGMRKDHILPEEKLKSRAKPQFKKPRYKWCRIPADVDIEALFHDKFSDRGSLCGQELDDSSMHGLDMRKMKQEVIETPLSTTSSVEEDTRQSPKKLDLIYEDTANIHDQIANAAKNDQSFNMGLDYEEFLMYRNASKDIINVISSFTNPYSGEFKSTLTNELCDLEVGFSTLEASVRKMIRVVPMMPFIKGFEKDLLSKIVKERVFGAIQIVSVLVYNFDKDAWTVGMEDSTGRRDVDIKMHDAILGTFGSLTSIPHGFRTFFSQEDVEHIYIVLKDHYIQMRKLYGNHRDFAAIVLLGIYFFQDDPFLSISAEQREIMRIYKNKYIRILRCFLRDLPSCQYSQLIEQETFLLLQYIKWLEVRYSDAARQVALNKVPPLMQELAVNSPSAR